MNHTGDFPSGPPVYCITGTVTITCPNLSAPPGSVTLMLVVDDTPIPASQMASSLYSYGLDTTTLSNGSHVLNFIVVDTTAAGGNAYFLSTASAATRVIVGNPSSVFGPGALQGAQDIWVNPQGNGVASALPSMPDRIHYDGNPSHIANAGYPAPYTAANPVLPASEDSRYASNLGALREANMWYAELTSEFRWGEYRFTPMLQTTQQGGVFSSGWTPQYGLDIFGSYDQVARSNPMDGNRLDGMQIPWVEYIEHPGGIGWLGAELQGRIVLEDYSGNQTTIFGWKRDRTALSNDISDLSITEDNISRVFVGTTSGPLAPFDIGGCNDLCADPRDMRANPCAFTASISGTTMTVSAVSSGALQMGTYFTGSGVATASRVVRQLTGTTGGAGTYRVAPSQTVGSTAMTGGTSALIYVVSPLDNFIAQIDLLHSGAPNGIVYAGLPGAASAYVDNAIDAFAARFGSPYSIAMANGTGVDPAGTMYVADRDNNAIRKVLPRTSGYVGANALGVTTLMGGSLVTQPSSFSDYAANFSTYLKTTAPWPAISAGHCLQVQVLRLTSAQDIVFMGTWDACVMHARLSTNELRFLNTWDANGPQAESHPFPWLDVDWAGACSPVDTIWAVITDTTAKPGGSYLTMALADGSIQFFSSEPQSGGFQGSSGLFGRDYLWQFGAYGWSMAVGRIYGRMIGGAIGSPNPVSLRIATVADLSIPGYLIPPYGGTNDSGWNCWMAGGPVPHVLSGGNFVGDFPVFPYNSLPSFACLMGPQGVARHQPLSGGNSTWEDLNANFPVDGDVTLSPGNPANAGTLAAYLQAGCGGHYPRPGLTGNDLRDLIYQIRRSTYPGSWPTPVALGPGDSDTTVPTITVTGKTRTGNSVTVTWTTSVPTYGGLAVGSTAQQGAPSYGSPYNLWAFEPYDNAVGYKTTGHTATVNNIPFTPVHYAVVVRTIAGQPAYTLDDTVF